MDRLILQISIGHDVEVALETLGDDGTTATWGSHGSDEDNVFNLLEGLLLVCAVVPALVIHPLTEEL